MRGGGEQPFAFARREAALGHDGQFLAAFELPEDWFHGAGPHLVVVPAAGMLQASPGAGGGREPVEVPGPLGSAGAVPVGVFGQRREEPCAAALAGAGRAVLTRGPPPAGPMLTT